MIVVVSTFEAVNEAGLKIGKTIFELVKKHYPEVNLDWWTPMSGTMGAQMMIWRHPSLAAKEAFDKKVFADTRWEKAWKDAGTGPFWTSQRDDYYSAVEP
jgi:hypothetical protein